MKHNDFTAFDHLPNPFRTLSVKAFVPWPDILPSAVARVEQIEQSLRGSLKHEMPSFLRYSMNYPAIFREKTVPRLKELYSQQFRDELQAVVIVGTGGNAIHAEIFQPLSPVPVIIADAPHPEIMGQIYELDRNRSVIVYQSRSGDTGEVNLLYDLFTNPRSGTPVFPHSLVLASKGRIYDAARRDGVPVIELPLDIAGRTMVNTDIVGVPFYLSKLLGETGSDLFNTVARIFQAHIDAPRDLAWWIPTFSYASQVQGFTNTWIAPYDPDAARAGYLANQLFNEGRGQFGNKALSHMRVGPRAQHETGQRIRGGAPDHFTLFLKVQNFRLPDLIVTASDSSYCGLSGGDFIRINCEAYANALTLSRLPHMTIELPSIAIEPLAELDALLLLWAWWECSYLGTGYDKNPDVDAAKIEANRLAAELREKRSQI